VESRWDGRRDIALSASFHEISSVDPQPQLFSWKSLFLSRDCGTSLRKKVFLVLALLNIPHSAYTRIYNSLTKQIADLIKLSSWNSRHMNFHSLTTSVSFNFLSFLVAFCDMYKASSLGPADKGFFELFLLFDDSLQWEGFSGEK